MRHGLGVVSLVWAGCFLGGLGTAQGQAATLPFTEGFEGGDPLTGYWAKSVTHQGEVLLTAAQGPHAGGVHAVFDDTINDFTCSRCSLTLFGRTASRSAGFHALRPVIDDAYFSVAPRTAGPIVF